jgi:hypothetical protein
LKISIDAPVILQFQGSGQYRGVRVVYKEVLRFREIPIIIKLELMYVEGCL